MNNEPVAWIDKNTGKPRMEGFIQTDYDIPLYTHPAKTDRYIADLKNLVDAQGQDGTWNSDKYMLGLFNGLELALSIFESREPKFRELPAKTLTDEEIISSAEEAEFNWSEDKGIFVRHSNGSWIGLDSKMVDFARAILRKAQEK